MLLLSSVIVVYRTSIVQNVRIISLFVSPTQHPSPQFRASSVLSVSPRLQTIHGPISLQAIFHPIYNCSVSSPHVAISSIHLLLIALIFCSYLLPYASRNLSSFLTGTSARTYFSNWGDFMLPATEKVAY